MDLSSVDSECLPQEEWQALEQAMAMVEKAYSHTNSNTNTNAAGGRTNHNHNPPFSSSASSAFPSHSSSYPPPSRPSYPPHPPYPYPPQQQSQPQQPKASPRSTSSSSSSSSFSSSLEQLKNPYADCHGAPLAPPPPSSFAGSSNHNAGYVSSFVPSSSSRFGRFQQQQHSALRTLPSSSSSSAAAVPSQPFFSSPSPSSSTFVENGNASSSSSPPPPPSYPPQQQHYPQQPQQRQPQQQAQGRTLPASLFQASNKGPLMLEMQLLSKHRFAVTTSGNETAEQSVALTELFSSLPSAIYSEEQKAWSFLLTKYSEVLNTLRGIPTVRLTTLPNTVVRVFVWKERPPLETNIDLSRIPTPLLNKLYPYQREGVIFAIQRRGRALIADEMGLGKTMQGIAIAAYYRNEWPALIIAPTSVRQNWADTFERDIPDLRREDITQVATGKMSFDGLINIISFDLAQRRADAIRDKNFKVIVVDESHNIKSHSAKRTKALVPVLKNSRRTVLLTGTPALSRPKELFSQLTAVDPNVFSSFPEFGVRYCNGFQDRFGWNFDGASNLQELHVLLEETVMIRRLKKDVLGQLPPKNRQKVYISLLDKHAKVLHQIFNEMKENRRALFSANNEHAKNAKMEKYRLLMELYKSSGASKLPSVVTYIKKFLREDNRKFIVFAHHQMVIQGVIKALEHERVEFIRIDGKTKPQDRQKLVTHFQENDVVRVAVLSMTAAGVGLTLTAAKVVLFAELFWNPGTLRQCEDRAHRIGQKDPVDVLYLVARGTLDEMIWDLIEQKLEVLGNTLNGEEEVLDVEEKEGKVGIEPDTVDYFLSRFLQQVENYDERRREFKERKAKEQLAKLGQSDNPYANFIYNEEDNDDGVANGTEGEAANEEWLDTPTFGLSSSSSSMLGGVEEKQQQKKDKEIEGKSVNGSDAHVVAVDGMEDWLAEFAAEPLDLSNVNGEGSSIQWPASSSRSSSSTKPPPRQMQETTNEREHSSKQISLTRAKRKFLDDSDDDDFEDPTPKRNSRTKQKRSPSPPSSVAGRRTSLPEKRKEEEEQEDTQKLSPKERRQLALQRFAFDRNAQHNNTAVQRRAEESEQQENEETGNVNSTYGGLPSANSFAFRGGSSFRSSVRPASSSTSSSFVSRSHPTSSSSPINPTTSSQVSYSSNFPSSTSSSSSFSASSTLSSSPPSSSSSTSTTTGGEGSERGVVRSNCLDRFRLQGYHRRRHPHSFSSSASFSDSFFERRN
ncbi:SWI/SNF-related matrix-associated actin-dependent regulator of chromatin subfamily A-like protein 1 [Balamuthia mandrillaris]